MKRFKRWIRLRWLEHKSGYRLPVYLRKWMLDNRPPVPGDIVCLSRATSKTVTLMIWTALWSKEGTVDGQ